VCLRPRLNEKIKIIEKNSAYPIRVLKISVGILKKQNNTKKNLF